MDDATAFHLLRQGHGITQGGKHGITQGGKRKTPSHKLPKIPMLFTISGKPQKTHTRGGGVLRQLLGHRALQFSPGWQGAA